KIGVSHISSSPTTFPWSNIFPTGLLSCIRVKSWKSGKLPIYMTGRCIRIPNHCFQPSRSRTPIPKRNAAGSVTMKAYMSILKMRNWSSGISAITTLFTVPKKNMRAGKHEKSAADISAALFCSPVSVHFREGADISFYVSLFAPNFPDVQPLPVQFTVFLFVDDFTLPYAFLTQHILHVVLKCPVLFAGLEDVRAFTPHFLLGISCDFGESWIDVSDLPVFIGHQYTLSH